MIVKSYAVLPVNPVEDADVAVPEIELLTIVEPEPATGACPFVLLILGVVPDNALTTT